METINRALLPKLRERMFRGKAIILVGARQIGKTTLFRKVCSESGMKYAEFSCDSPEIRRLLKDIPENEIPLLTGDNRIIMIDEAQRVENIGLTIKRLIERYPDRQFLVTGSSSLHLRSNINEPLTGRKFEYELFPISTDELLVSDGLVNTRDMLERRLIYGSYPEIVTHPGDALELLSGIAGSYLYKDILDLEGIRRPVLLEKLLIALALQVGSEVSYNELAQTVGSDPKTVEKYVDLLEKSYVVKILNGLSRNLRNELKKGKKIYFYDTGIRNAILHNFSPVEVRTDIGSLWENFFIMERMKYNAYRGAHQNYYFWRSTAQQAVDFIEERDGEMLLFEIKWNPKKSNVRFPRAFIEAYPVGETAVITPENYIDWLR